ncbi:MAG: tRNA (adenosine(37)-N6)-threonylcarbamoyltransferase complex dimerization subunit type 1 TsaB [Sodalis sp. (in: enterobacteria)]
MSTRILAIDTATEACSAALMLDEDILLERFTLSPREHTQHILPMVDRILAEAGIALKNLDVLVFSRGPGSFTGIRIGIGIVQGLGLGADLPLIGVSTLAVLAEGAWRQTGVFQVLSAIDAYMGEVYWAPYQRQAAGIWVGEEREMVATPKVLTSLGAGLSGCWATAGNGWQTYPTLFNHEGLTLVTSGTLLTSAQDMLPLALYHYRRGAAKAAAFAEPVYLCNKVTWKKIPSRIAKH